MNCFSLHFRDVGKKISLGKQSQCFAVNGVISFISNKISRNIFRFVYMSTEIWIGLAGLLLALLAYVRSFKPAPKEEPVDERENLKAYFFMVQKIYIDTQKLIERYIQKHNAGKEIIFDNVTYEYYLAKMKLEYQRCNSDEAYNNVLTLPLSKSNIDSMMDSLKIQYNSMTQLKFKMKSY